jgi:hypothetical protein
MKNPDPKPAREPDLANLDEAELASNQEQKVIPMWAGERMLAVTWISPIYNQFTRPAPQIGKK